MTNDNELLIITDTDFGGFNKAESLSSISYNRSTNILSAKYFVLPKESFVKCVKWWNTEKRAYLVVADEWFDSLSEARYSTFAMVDAIGVKKILEDRGILDREKIKKFRKRLNNLSRRYRRHVLHSFADSVLIKTSFKGSLWYFLAYKPEETIELVQEIRKLFVEELGLDSYAIVSQGTMSDYSSKVYEKSFLGNHFSIASLGTPFAHLFEIESAARINSKQGIHDPSSLYITSKCFRTFHLNDSFRTSAKEVHFISKVGHHEDNVYIPLSIDDVISNFSKKSKRDLFSRLRFYYLWEWRTYFKRKQREIKLRFSRGKIGLSK